jgi:hypothetical protein
MVPRARLWEVKCVGETVVGALEKALANAP